MEHEKSIFLSSILTKIGISEEESINIYNVILVNKGEILTPTEVSELSTLLSNICQICDSPNDPPMSNWDKEQRILLGQFLGKLYKIMKI